MAKVYLGLGSNVDPERHLQFGIQELAQRFGDLELSNVYRNQAVGFTGDDFLNVVVGLESSRTPADIHAEIEALHVLANRQREESRYSPRTLDIDLLLYDDLIVDTPPIRIPRDDILKYSFVLGPLAEIAPQLRHPQTGRTMADHWQAFDQSQHPLQRVDAVLVAGPASPAD